MRFRFLGFIAVLIFATQFIVAQKTIDADSVAKKTDVKRVKISDASFDLNSLIKDISTDTQQNAFAGYFYKMEFRRVKRNFIGTGKMTKRYEVLLPSLLPKQRHYRHPLLLVYDSTKRNLTKSDVAENRRNIIKQIDSLDRDIADKTDEGQAKKEDGGYLTLSASSKLVGDQALFINLLELLNNSKFSNPKTLKYNERDAISVDFRPLSNKKFDESMFYLGLIEGTILVDKEDRRIIEVEGFPKGKLKEYRSPTVKNREAYRIFHYLQTRVPEGFWFPKIVTINFMKFSKLYNDIEMKMDFEFSDYRRFTADVGKVAVDGEAAAAEAKAAEKAKAEAEAAKAKEDKVKKEDSEDEDN